MGDYQDAVTDINEAQFICPLSFRELQWRQEYLQGLFTHNSAATCSSATLPAQLLPDMQDADELYRFANDKHSQGDCDGALAALNRAAQISPADPRIWHERATVKMTAGEHQAALQDLQTLVELDESWDQANVFRMQGLCYAKQQDWHKALANTDAAVRLRPRHGEFLWQRSSIKYAMHDFDSALEDVSASLHQAPGLAEAWQLKAEILHALDQPEAALKAVDMALSLLPNDHDILALRGRIQEAL